ncbi:MAG: hypothetical protein M1821_008743 [Bathelium mastoideum]|nr:MAG: hypothetical protein M1821_008743 [Bathelium mastoideum]KAI9685903.1 MAG: hypothetical protein M1822_004181 [Bathelium mastoideum]
MSTPNLSEEDIDDILYFARTNDLSELRTILTSLAGQTGHSQVDTLLAARDPDSDNTVAHYAAANGFDDLLKWLLTLSRPASTTSAPSSDTSSPAAPNDTPSASQPSATPTETNAKSSIPPPSLFTTPNALGSTPLHYAATTGALACATVLVEAGVNVRARNGVGHTPAYEAEVAGREEVVEYLLRVGRVEDEDEGDGEQKKEEEDKGTADIGERVEGMGLGGKEGEGG